MFERIGFRTSGLRSIPLLRALEGIRDAGYQAVEFCLEHPGATETALESARGMGLGISAVSYHGKRDTKAERLRLAADAVSLAKNCGVRNVLFGSPLTGDASFHIEAEKVFRLAMEKNLLPCWETEPGTVLNGLKDMDRHIFPLGPEAGLNLDAGHLHLQGTCTREIIGSLGSRIHHVHLEGMQSGRHRHLIPGGGDVDWFELLSGLEAARFSGPLIIDLFDLPENWGRYILDARIALKEIISYYLENTSSGVEE